MAVEPAIHIRSEGNRLFVSGPVVYGNVIKVSRAGMAMLDKHDMVIDLAEVAEVDSSAVSMLLEWLRSAQTHGQQIRFINFPANLAGLIKLYDVGGLISVDLSVESS